MIERIGQITYNFEEKHPVLAHIIGFTVVYLIGLLITLAVLYKVL